MKEITLGDNDAGQRFDRFLSKYLSHLPVSLISKLIRKKRFRINGAVAKHAQTLNAGDVIAMYLPDDMLPQSKRTKSYEYIKFLPLPEIVYEDENILISDKPAGLLVHSGTTSDADTLISRILRHLYENGSWNPAEENSFVPALCHRLDRNTQGLVVAAKSAAALREMNSIIKKRELRRYYICMVKGVPYPRQGELRSFILKDNKSNTVTSGPHQLPGSRRAITKYRVLRSDVATDTSLVECELITGRTHQIRAQMASAGWGLVGDYKYGTDRTIYGQVLCAYKLDFSRIDKNSILGYLKECSFTVKDIPFAPGFIRSHG